MAWQVPLLILEHTQFLLMSATLGNTAVIEERLKRRTGVDVVHVHSDERPVPLDYHYRETPLQETLEEGQQAQGSFGAEVRHVLSELSRMVSTPIQPQIVVQQAPGAEPPTVEVNDGTENPGVEAESKKAEPALGEHHDANAWFKGEESSEQAQPADGIGEQETWNEVPLDEPDAPQPAPQDPNEILLGVLDRFDDSGEDTTALQPEEALALASAGIPFRVVPGITAATGGLAYAGIPVTHRDVNTAVTFITGHNVRGDVPDNLDWQALARGAPVLVFYMALKHIDEVVARLIAGGRDSNEPAALIASATTQSQTVIETTLAQAPAHAGEVTPPALFVVGEVVRLRTGLDWLGALTGRVLDADPLDLNTNRDAG